MAGRATIRTRRWSRGEYERMIDLGLFRPGERLELIEGRLLVKEPQNTPHATAISLAAEALRAAFGTGWLVRVQLPVALGRWSEPEPDVCVVPGTPRDYRDAHPGRPALVLEVADSGLKLDRTRKAAVYARAGVADYWIVNLAARVLEVHREPARLDRARRRWGYRAVQRLGPAESVSPLAAPAASVAVADLLP